MSVGSMVRCPQDGLVCVRAAEWKTGCLGVLHVPKTGGSALRVALSQVPGCYIGHCILMPATLARRQW